ncbi:acyltransferase family protein [Lysobacter panacisoli]|uniref:Acyltransferase family protein n=1 Tax=Lysobacter panacisoli TaxID=1255263 RepID=A0ABP9L8C5_9GAMM|nr:acyltransferase family protein [Lysobacter panacisoli]
MSALGYKREIDGLRAVAVLSVVLYHAEPSWLPGGFLGVDVFFVISGYLIASLLLIEHRQTGTLDFVGFYARRVRRLLPALTAVVLATVAMGAALLDANALRALMLSAGASLLFAGNLFFQFTTGNYFDTPAEEVPLLHLWSLGVEEQFYLLLPGLLLLALRRSSVRGVGIALVLGSIVSLALAEYWMQSRPSIAFFQMPARFWEFAIGALVAIAPRGALRSQAAIALSWLGLCAILGSVALGTTHFPGLGAAPVVLGAGALLWSIHDAERPGGASVLLRTRPAVFFGLISYSLYLWHWPLLAFQREVVWQSSTGDRLWACAAAVVLACLSYRFIETPFRRPASAKDSRRRTVIVGATASAVLALTFVLARPAPLQDPRTAGLDQPENMQRCHYGLGKDVQRLQSSDCYSEPGSSPRVVLWGDSHALAWQPFAWSVAAASGTSAASFTLDACPPLGNFDTRLAEFPRHRDTCRRFNALATAYVREHRPDEVILAGRWLLLFEPRTNAATSYQTPESVGAGIDQTVAAVAPYAKKVVLMGPLPRLEASAAKCLADVGQARCAMSREQYEQLSKSVWATFRRIAAKHPNVELVNPADFFCGPTTCPASRDGYALFWDANHVSSTAARHFARAYLADPARWQARATPAAP